MRKIALLALLAMSASVFANSNYVHWVGGTGDWMVSGNWTNEDPAPDWNIPGWVVGNPWNTGNSTALDWNYGRAIIESGTARITPSSAPDGTIAKLYLGGTNGAHVEMSADAQFKDIYIADTDESATVSQTAGNVVLSGNAATHIGRRGTGTYNLSGGTLTHNSTTGADTYTYIGVYNGADGTFNQTGGTFTKNGDIQQNMVVGYAAGAKGIVNLSGGTFHHDVGDDFALGDLVGSEGYLNVSGTAAFRVGDGTGVPAVGEPAGGWGILYAGKSGYGKVVQTGGSVEANYLKIGNYTSGVGDYIMSGGSLDLHAYLYIPKSGSFVVSGSGMDHVRMNRFVPQYNFVGIELDADGSTLIEVTGLAGDRYNKAYNNARWQVNTLSDFNGQVSDKYDVMWSATTIDDGANYNWFNSIGTAEFDWEIAATNGGEMLRFIMTGTKTNAVVWSGTGDWMDSNHWADVAPTPDWTIPGQGSLNEGEALIRSGEASITAASNPDSPVARLDLGGTAGATLNVTGGDVEFKEVTLAEAGQVATVNQSAGNVLFTGNTRAYVGRYGHGIYNLSGGTLTHTSESGADCNTFIGVDRGSVGIFNQTGGTFVKNGSVQQNIYVAYYSRSVGRLNLSGGEFRHESGDSFVLGNFVDARGTLNLSGTALLQIGDGIGTGTAEPPTGYGIFAVGNEGYGEVNQTGGSLDAIYLKIADSTTTGEGVYTISGGSMDIHRYVKLSNGNKSTMTIAGSGADHIKTKRFELIAGSTLNLQLDENGSSLIEVVGTENDSWMNDALLRGTVTADTLEGFNAPTGTVFDVLWSAALLETTSMTFTNLSDRVSFSWQVVAKDNGGVPGQMLQLVVASAKTPLDLWAEGYGLAGGEAAASADPDEDGVNNLYEFGLGGDPTDSLDQGTAPEYAVVDDGGGNVFRYIHPQLPAPDSGGVSYYLELTDDLVYGTWTNSGYAVTGTNVTGEALDFVTNTTDTVDDEQFIRLIISSPQMDVISWNILGIDTVGYTNWSGRAPFVADTLRYSAGVIGLQEIRYRDIADYMQAALGDGGYTAFPSSNLGIQVRGTSNTVLTGDGLEGRHWQNIIYYKSSVFEQIDGGQFALDEGSPAPDFFAQRSVTWVKLKQIGTGQSLVVINTHLSPHEQSYRISSTADIKTFVQSFSADLPVVVLGDFNAESDSSEMQHLTADGTLTSVIEQSGQIDYVLQRNLQDRLGHEYESKYEEGMALSDHPMLTAKLMLDEDL